MAFLSTYNLYVSICNTSTSDIQCSMHDASLFCADIRSNELMMITQHNNTNYNLYRYLPNNHICYFSTDNNNIMLDVC